MMHFFHRLLQRTCYLQLIAVLLAIPFGASAGEPHVVYSSAHVQYRDSNAAAQAGEFRAGCPQMVAWYAVPAETNQHSYGWAGGGALVRKSESRSQHEGTWGRDYSLFSMHTIWLGWSHGARKQGGGGAYEADGPKLHLHK